MEKLLCSKSNRTSTELGVGFDRCLVEGRFKEILNVIPYSVARTFSVWPMCSVTC